MKINIMQLQKLAILIFILSNASCASHTTADDNISNCYYPDQKDALAPGWLCNKDIPGYQATAIGSADKSAAGKAFMKQRAITNARVKLTQQFSSNVEAMLKSHADKNSNQLSLNQRGYLTDRDLVKIKLVYMTQSPAGKLYVLIGLKNK